MLVHVKTLSIWEIAHYWHNLDPRASTTHNLPLRVRDTLLVLAMWCGKKLAYRVESEKAYQIEVLKQAARFTPRHYRHSIQKAIDSKVFGKRLFSNMHVSRSQLARLCVSHNQPLPEFWFPDNEKYPYDATGDLADETTVGGRFKLILLYDDTKADAQAPEQPITATVGDNVAKTKGVTKGAIINAFGGLHFNQDQWDKYLASPPKWLEDCRVAKGNKKTSATWNPVLIAAALFDKQIPIKKLDAVFVGLPEWADDWRLASEHMR